MSHIIEFKISGLVGRKDVYKQKLNRDVNIFFGPNGSGKTSLLRILDSAMTGDSSSIEFVPFESAEVKIYSLKYKKESVRSINMGDLNYKPSKRKPKEYKIPEYFDEETGPIRVPRQYKEGEMPIWKTTPMKPDLSRSRWEHIYLPTWRLYGEDEPYSIAMRRGEPPQIQREYDWDAFFAQRLEELWISFTNQLLREVRIIQEEGLASILRGILTTKPSRKRKMKSLDLERTYSRVAAFLARQGSQDVLGSLDMFEKRYVDDSQIQGVISDINTIEQRIEETMASREKLKQLITDMFTGKKKLMFKDVGIEVETDDGKKIGLTSLSSGEKHSLWIFIETLLAESNTLLIDEPEMSMHVDWQNRLISSMCQLNPDVQLIMATHSPEIMADITDDKIFTL